MLSHGLNFVKELYATPPATPQDELERVIYCSAIKVRVPCPPFPPPCPTSRTNLCPGLGCIGDAQAAVTWNAEDTATICRERCGGMGYLSANRFGDIIGFAHAGMTAEGGASGGGVQACARIVVRCTTVVLCIATPVTLTLPMHPPPSLRWSSDNRVLYQKVTKEVAGLLQSRKWELPSDPDPTAPLPGGDSDLAGDLLRRREAVLFATLGRRLQMKVGKDKSLFEVRARCRVIRNGAHVQSGDACAASLAPVARTGHKLAPACPRAHGRRAAHYAVAFHHIRARATFTDTPPTPQRHPHPAGVDEGGVGPHPAVRRRLHGALLLRSRRGRGRGVARGQPRAAQGAGSVRPGRRCPRWHVVPDTQGAQHIVR